jgi:hypothetical protein
MNIKALLLLFVLIGTFACNQKKEDQNNLSQNLVELNINTKEIDSLKKTIQEAFVKYDIDIYNNNISVSKDTLNIYLSGQANKKYPEKELKQMGILLKDLLPPANINISFDLDIDLTIGPKQYTDEPWVIISYSKNIINIKYSQYTTSFEQDIKGLSLFKNIKITDKIIGKWYVFDKYTKFYLIYHTNNFYFINIYGYSPENNDLTLYSTKPLIQFSYYDSDIIEYKSPTEFSYIIDSKNNLLNITLEGLETEGGIYLTADKLIL